MQDNPKVNIAINLPDNIIPLTEENKKKVLKLGKRIEAVIMEHVGEIEYLDPDTGLTRSGEQLPEELRFVQTIAAVSYLLGVLTTNREYGTQENRVDAANAVGRIQARGFVDGDAWRNFLEIPRH